MAEARAKRDGEFPNALVSILVWKNAKATGVLPRGLGLSPFIIQRPQFVDDRQNTAEYLNSISTHRLHTMHMILIAPAFVINNFWPAHTRHYSHAGDVSKPPLLFCFRHRPAEATDHAATSIAATALDPFDWWAHSQDQPDSGKIRLQAAWRARNWPRWLIRGLCILAFLLRPISFLIF